MRLLSNSLGLNKIALVSKKVYDWLFLLLQIINSQLFGDNMIENKNQNSSDSTSLSCLWYISEIFVFQ